MNKSWTYQPIVWTNSRRYEKKGFVIERATEVIATKSNSESPSKTVERLIQVLTSSLFIKSEKKIGLLCRTASFLPLYKYWLTNQRSFLLIQIILYENRKLVSSPIETYHSGKGSEDAHIFHLNEFEMKYFFSHDENFWI